MKKADIWKPSNNIIIPEEIEKNILKNVDENILVIAGPGSGKTEMLAQKASFLFETNLCRNPYKILALSYKVDAAKTLKDRVNKRCGYIANSRFDSFTLDAFLFLIVQRFYKVLPDWLEPLPQKLNMCSDDKLLIRDIFSADIKQQLRINKHIKSGYIPWNLMKNLGYSILLHSQDVRDIVSSPYQYVFIDEFQDTTDIHYEILILLFNNKNVRCMAVGDSKQAIMGFAGALNTIFEKYTADFNAVEYPLNYNYRSNNNIVDFINKVIEKFSPQFIKHKMVAYKKSEEEYSVFQNGQYKNYEEQFTSIANFISNKISNSHLKQHDFVIVKRTNMLHEDIKYINDIFIQYGLLIRNDTDKIYNNITIQNLLEYQLSRFFIHFFAYMEGCITPENYQELLFIYSIYKNYDISESTNYDIATKNILTLRNQLIEMEDIAKIVKCIAAHFEPKIIIAVDKDVQNNEKFNDIIQAFLMYFESLLLSVNSRYEAISKFYGENQIKIMTIHKSKGMEYDTVFFLDFNSNEWNIFKTGDIKDKISELKVFFVGISRAKNTLIFTKNNDDSFPSDMEDIIQQMPVFK